MVAKLPRELRDMVYDYFLEADNDRLAMRDFRIFSLRPKSSGLGHERFRGPYPPYFTLPTCVHATFALEVSEALYCSAIVRIEDASWLDSLLEGDVMQAACSPRDHIRRLEVELSTGRDIHKSKFEACVSQMHQLLTINNLRGLNVRFVSKERDVPYLNRYEELTAPIVHALNSKGVVVTWSEIDDDGDVVRDLTVKDRNFSCTLQELKDDIAINTVFVSTPTVPMRRH